MRRVPKTSADHSLPSLALAWTVYALWVLRLLHRLLSRELVYLDRLKPNTAAQCRAAARYDWAHLSRLELYVGALLLVPVRLVLSAPFLVLWYVCAWVPKTWCGGRRS